MKLFIGNKNYSSWSLRPWLLMRVKDLPFEEQRIVLDQPGSKASLLRASPSGRVPVLVDGDRTIWDSLAIVEYLAERFPQSSLWPTDADARALARSITCEMHAGFAALRTAMPMNCRARLPGKGHTDAALADASRIVASWEYCRGLHAAQGDFLFGRFCIADAFYAPVVLRFETYGVSLPTTARRYADALLALPAMQDWLAAADGETEIIAADEPYR